MDGQHPCPLRHHSRGLAQRSVGMAIADQQQALRPFPSTLNRSNFMINLIVWLVVGGVIGWLASLIMRTDAQQGVFLNVIVGIIGAALGGWLISPLVGVGSINDAVFSIGALLVSLVGAVILLAIFNLFRRGSPR
jgi:uncharacterized membrane protein YeaQ/YmgE (transglycosylase-associated protein family)